jgi:hypothetical protein
MNKGVAAIWWAMLIATVFGVVPLVVAYLTRARQAAEHIERYTAEILAAGVGVAQNTANVAALKDTLAVAPQLVAGAESLARHAAQIESALAAGQADKGPGPESTPQEVAP